MQVMLYNNRLLVHKLGFLVETRGDLRLACRGARDLVDELAEIAVVSLPVALLMEGREHSYEDDDLIVQKAARLGAELGALHARRRAVELLRLDAEQIAPASDFIVFTFMKSYVEAEGIKQWLGRIKSCEIAPAYQSYRVDRQSSALEIDCFEDGSLRLCGSPLPGEVWHHLAPHLASVTSLVLGFTPLCGPLKEPASLRMLPGCCSAQVKHLRLVGSAAARLSFMAEQESMSDDSTTGVDAVEEGAHEWLGRAGSVLRAFPLTSVHVTGMDMAYGLDALSHAVGGCHGKGCIVTTEW